MALSKRERNLAIVTGVLLFPFAVWLVVGALGGSTRQLRAQKANLLNQINETKAEIRRAREAQERLNDWNRQSLPQDPESAGSQYQYWLWDLCKSDQYQVDLQNTTIKPLKSQPLGEAGHMLSFTVRGIGSLEQLTRWLYGFYDAQYLHQIKGITIRPLEGSTKLDIDLKVEALALTGAIDREGKPRANSLPELPQEAIDKDLLDKYCDTISGRAIFSRYTPPAPVRPPDAPRVEPSRPLFDHGKFTFVTGITEINGRPQVWIESRTAGKKFRLFEGDSFEVGPVQARIVEIRGRSVTSEVDGKQYLIALGENLREAKELPENRQ